MVNATLRPLYLRECPGSHCIRGWVGLKAGLDRKDLERNKFFATEVRVSNPPARSGSPPPVPDVYCTYRNEYFRLPI